MHLTPKSCVVSLLKMLTYARVCSAFSSTHALLLVVIYNFRDRFNSKLFHNNLLMKLLKPVQINFQDLIIENII